MKVYVLKSICTKRKVKIHDTGYDVRGEMRSSYTVLDWLEWSDACHLAGMSQQQRKDIIASVKLPMLQSPPMSCKHHFFLSYSCVQTNS